MKKIKLSEWALHVISEDIKRIELFYGQALTQIDIDRAVTRAVSTYTTDLEIKILSKKTKGGMTV